MPTKHRSKKDRRNSGRYTPSILKPTMKYDEIKISALEPLEEYDDWIERRDGWRDYETYKKKREERGRHKPTPKRK